MIDFDDDIPNNDSTDSVVDSRDNNIYRKSLGEIGLAQFSPYLMNRIMGHWNASMQEQLRQHNLNVIKMRAIAVLSIISGLTINELSVYTVAEQSTMSRSLDALEKQSLIRRVSSEEDGRVRRIYITDLGRETFDKIWPIMYENHQNLIQGISQEEHKLLIKVLQKMQLNLENS